MSDSDLFSILNTVDSTNNYAMAHIRQGAAKDGSCWFAKDQTEGRGQRGKVWKSEKGKNIAMSIILKPKGVFQQNPFVLNALISVTTLIALSNNVEKEDFYIKWPNDIIWNDKKAAGILIENLYSGRDWHWCVTGIGINVKQKKFSADLPHATSLEILSNKIIDPETLAREIYKSIIIAIESFTEGDIPALMSQYNNFLYQQGKWVKFKKDNAVFESKVIEVNKYGVLITADVMERQFHFGELQWVLKSEKN